MASRIYFNNRQQSGRPLLIASLDEEAFSPGLWLTAWLVSSADCPVELAEWPVPLNELNLAVERVWPRGLLLYASHCLSAGSLQRHLPRLLEQSAAPLLIAGPAVHIHAPELRQHRGLLLSDCPFDALQQLNNAGLLPGSEGSAS